MTMDVYPIVILVLDDLTSEWVLKLRNHFNISRSLRRSSGNHRLQTLKRRPRTYKVASTRFFKTRNGHILNTGSFPYNWVFKVFSYLGYDWKNADTSWWGTRVKKDDTNYFDHLTFFQPYHQQYLLCHITWVNYVWPLCGKCNGFNLVNILS